MVGVDIRERRVRVCLRDPTLRPSLTRIKALPQTPFEVEGRCSWSRATKACLPRFRRRLTGQVHQVHLGLDLETDQPETGHRKAVIRAHPGGRQAPGGLRRSPTDQVPTSPRERVRRETQVQHQSLEVGAAAERVEVLVSIHQTEIAKARRHGAGSASIARSAKATRSGKVAGVAAWSLSRLSWE